MPEVTCRNRVGCGVHASAGVIHEDVESHPQIENDGSADSTIITIYREKCLPIYLIVIQGLYLGSAPVGQAQTVNASR